MNEKRKILNEITNLVIKYGERRDKKHGNWYKFKYSNDLFIQLDSWNGMMNIMREPSEYNYHIGWDGVKLKHMGGASSWTFDNELEYEIELYQFWLDNIKMAVESYYAK